MQPRIRSIKTGEALFKEGDNPMSMFIVQKGSLSIRKPKPGGYVELAKVHQNEVVGELSFFDRQPRSATAVALAETEVVEVTFASLEPMWQKVPPYIRTILTCVADRLRGAGEIIRRVQKTTESDEKEKVAEDLDTSAVLAALADEVDEATKSKK